MKTVKFIAPVLDIRSDDAVENVFLGNEEEEKALLLSVAKPGGASYIEFNDQSNACYDGVKSVGLTDSTVQVVLNAQGAKKLGCEEIIARIECTKEEYHQLAASLQTIFGKKLKAAAPSKKAKAAKPKPAKDYSKIRYLNLEGKNLKTLPAEVADMFALETVKLARNPKLDVEAAIDVLSKHPNVKDLAFTTEKAIPSNIGALKSLEHLSIDGLKTEHTAPASIAQLTNLKYLYIRSEAKLALPEEIATLSELESLHIQAPEWNLPTRFYQLTRLTHLSFDGCNIQEIPEGIAEMKNLDSIHLYGANQFDYAQALRYFAQISSLTKIHLSLNPIPKEIGLLRQITELVIRTSKGDPENPLTLPDEIWELNQLTELDICGYYLTQIPDRMANLRALKSLSFYESAFRELPDAIGELEQLELLNLGENPTLEKLPGSIGKLKNLKQLILSGSPKLTELPSSLKSLPELKIYHD